MKRLLHNVLILIAVAGLLPARAQLPQHAGAETRQSGRHTPAVFSPLDEAIGVVERAYAGFPDKTAGCEAAYAALKERLRAELAAGRDPFDAVAEYIGWFDDSHLRVPGAESYRQKTRRRGNDYHSRMKIYDPQVTHCRVDGDTYLIRLPSCDPDNVPPQLVQRMVDAFLASGCRNLIVDLRGNAGGNADTYEPLLRLLYDREGVLDNEQYRVSELSIAHVREFSGGSERGRRRIERMRQTTPGAFLSIQSTTYRIRYDTVSPLPRRAALLIDGRVASSGEQLVLEVRACSSRTTVYGQDNTLGCLDYSNCQIVHLAQDTARWMVIPVTRSCRVDAGRGIDRDGIAPDVRIPLPLPDTLTANVDTWVGYVAEELKTEKPE